MITKEQDTLTLEQKAKLLITFVEKHMVDDKGIVYSTINSKTNRPWTENDYSSEDEYQPVAGFSRSEIENYENSGMTTGAFLASQSFRYQVTHDPIAMVLARRGFEGLCHIYEIGKQKEEGYFPKTYGCRYSEEASTDQYLYAMKGMMAYLQVADSDHVAMIRRMIPCMVDFWVKRDYRRDYFGIRNMQWPLGRFPSFLIMAYAVSNEIRYLDEFCRLNSEYKVYEKPAESQLIAHKENHDKICDYEKHLGKYLFMNLGECAAMDIMELDECLLHSGAYPEYWLASMRQMWHEGQLEITENGLAYCKFLYDPQTGEVSAPSPSFIFDVLPNDWSMSFWVGGMLMGRSTFLARAGIHVAKWLPQEMASDVVIRILSKIQFEHMRNYIDPDGTQMLTKHSFLCNEVSGDAIVNWLWAYWQGRAEHVIGSDL